MADIKNEYISKANALWIAALTKAPDETKERLTNMDAADVQPVNRWISVKDKMPDKYGWYLVMAHNRVRAYEWSIEGWYNERDLPVDDKVVTYWQPLPEPPKDGDAE